MLATSRRGAMLRFDAVGCAASHGNTVTKPAAADPVAVTSRTPPFTAYGVPARPATTMLKVAPAASGPSPASRPSMVEASGRVSARRAGVSGMNSGFVPTPPAGGVESVVGGPEGGVVVVGVVVGVVVPVVSGGF